MSKHLTAEDVHHMIYLIKYLIKSSMMSRQKKEKKCDVSAIFSEYYKSTSEAELLMQTQAEIKPSENHVTSDIGIGLIMSDEENISDESENTEDEHGNQIDVFEKNLESNLTDFLGLTSIDAMSQH